MGGGTYTEASYSAFANTVRSASTNEIFTQREVHETRNPDKLGIREARDGEDHPKSLPIIVGLDVTGSMGYIPTNIIKKGLGTLVGDTIKGGIEDPAIMFLAIGDHHSDSAPIQVGQFESSDQLLVESLKTIYIEGRGGGTMEESYLLAWYVAAFHTVTDNWEKRKKKGILITIGDEKSHSTFSTEQQIFGAGQGIKHTDKELLALAQEQWDVYHIHANDGSYPVESSKGQQVLDYWKELLGQNVIVVNDHNDIASEISKIIIQHENAGTSDIKEDTGTGIKEDTKDTSSGATPML